jgi:hypothetical protein
MFELSKKRIAITAMLTGLILVGAGCISAIDDTTDTVITGAFKTPLTALDKAKQLSGNERARVNRQNEEISNYVTTALILTEGSEVPEGAVLGPAIGCNDQVALVQMSRVDASGAVVVDALNTLFALKNPSYKGFYSALAFSSLKAPNQNIATTDGVNVTIRIDGELMSAGACDDPRIKAQVEETIRHFHPNFTILLNGSESAWRCFGDQSGLCK